MTSVGNRLRARALLRRHLWATVALGVFAGVAAGAALGAWGIARRTSTVYERFVSYEDSAQTTIVACPEGVDTSAADFDFKTCATYDPVEVADFVRTQPGVASVGRYTLAIVGIASAGDPASWQPHVVPVALDPAAVNNFGRPIVVAGRLADPMAVDEVVVNEEYATSAGLGTGDQIVVTPYSISEFDAAGEGVAPPHGTRTIATIVGVIRRSGDLVNRLSGPSIQEGNDRVEFGPGWWQSIDGDAATYAIGVILKTTDGSTIDDVQTALAARWPGRFFGFGTVALSSASTDSTVSDAIELQATGLALVALVIALAAIVFVGQAVARQVRREWSDRQTLVALGMTRSDMTAAAALRAVPIGALACVIAAVAVVAVSPVGPFGIGRAAEPHRGIAVDPAVLLLGLPIVVLIVLVVATLPVAAQRHRRATAISSSLTSSRLPPTGLAGWSMTSSRRAGGFALGSAVTGVAFAALAATAAWTLMTSYDDLIASPARYGATWDVSVGNVASDAQDQATRETLRAIPGIRSVGIMSATDLPADPTFILLAFEPFLGDVDAAAISEGRPPIRPTEIALGRRTMKKYGLAIGDTIALPPGDPDPTDLVVVGEVVLNDALSARAGDGGLVTAEAFDQLTAGNRSQSFVVWIDRDVDRDATLAALRAAFPTTFISPHASRQIVDFGLISGQSALVALIVGLLAGAALVHALVMSVRLGRHQIGVWKTLGFTRRQVIASVAWHASGLAGLALAIGIPLGIVVGRVTWSAIAKNFGVVSPPSLPVAAIFVVGLLVIAVANLAAIVPGLAAARTSPAAALRTE